jgi:2-octaprenyl-6-methoxyphenol hydroxylase
MANQAACPIIIGGGPVGISLALALQQQGLVVKVLEAKAKAASYQDKRALALSYGTKVMLEKLGAWESVAQAATPIETIHISQRGGFGRSHLKAAEHGLPALGYVVSYGALMQSLETLLNPDNIQYLAPVSAIRHNAQSAEVDAVVEDASVTFHSALVVVADGGRSLDNIPGIDRETKAYGHDALVSKVSAQRPHQQIAYERFTPTGPMALLPNGERDFSLVWTGEKSTIDRLLTIDDATFLKELHEAFGDRVGEFLTVEKRLSFPLKLSALKSHITPHLVIIGNAAQTMHPVAGQGFNVGMRDAWALAKLMSNVPSEALGEAEMLLQYQQQRQRDTKRGLLFTDFLVNVFSNDLVGVSMLRGLGLGVLEHLPPLKRFLVNKMSFGR